MYGDLKRLLGLRGQPKRVDSVSQLAKMEEQHDITDIYLWLRCVSTSCLVVEYIMSVIVTIVATL